MTARVRVAGNPLGALGPVSGLEWVTRWSYDQVSGDATAQWQWATTERPAWLHAGADVVIGDQGRRRWRGRLSEPEENDAGWSCAAYGLGVLAADFDAIYNATTPPAEPAWSPTMIPDTAIDAAITRGLPWVRSSSVGSTAIGQDDDSAVLDVLTLLLRAAKLAGKRAVVDQFGVVSLQPDPASPSWLLGGMSNYLGTADDEFVTRMWGYYVSGVDGATGAPNAWGLVKAEDNDAADKFGQHIERTVDLRELGLLTSAQAQANVDGRFALVGGRMGWTAGFVISPLWLRTLSGEPANPLAVRAGQMIRMPGVRDSRSQKTNRAAAQLVVGEARCVADEGACYVTPLGYVPRDFSSALAAARKPETTEAA